METKIIPREQVLEVALTLPKCFATSMLFFSPGNIPLVDEGVAIYEGDALVGLATIAPHGERMSEEPAIIGFYIVPGHRRKGYGLSLLLAAIAQVKARGFNCVHIDAVSEGMVALVVKAANSFIRCRDYSACYQSLE